MKPETRERGALLLGALSHPGRLRVAELLASAGGEGMSVGAIAAALGLGQSSASQHLAHLTRAGVLAVEQRGTTRLYRVRGPRIGRILALIEEFCDVHGLYGDSAESGLAARAGAGLPAGSKPD